MVDSRRGRLGAKATPLFLCFECQVPNSSTVEDVEASNNSLSLYSIGAVNVGWSCIGESPELAILEAIFVTGKLEGLRIVATVESSPDGVLLMIDSKA